MAEGARTTERPGAERAGPTRYAAAAAAVYALVFVALAVDVAVRLWTMRARFESATDAPALIAADLVRAAVGTAAAAVGVWLAWSGRRAATRALGLMLLFADVAYLKVFAGSFPGFMQERLAHALLSAGISQRILTFVFGDAVWAMWLALAAFVRFAVGFPRPLTPAAIVAAGDADRRGALRSVSFAGADVGAAFRGLVAKLRARGWLGTAPVWLTAAALGTLAALTEDSIPARTAGWVLFGVFAGIGITAARAGRVEAGPHERDVFDWLVRAAAAAAITAGGFAAISVLPAPEAVAFVLFVVAPVVVLGCTWMAARAAAAADREDWRCSRAGL